LFPVAICLLGTISVSASHVTLRYLRLTDHSLVIVNSFAFIISLTSLTILLKQGNIVKPKLNNLLIFILLGLVALFSQIAVTKSYQVARTNLVSLYSYFQIVFTGIFIF
jgi:drug/metabolite transporter (DMT)-like permease